MNRQRSREELELLLDRLPVGIQVCNRQGVITLSNDFHARMHGYRPGELVGRTIWSLVKDEKQRADLPGYLAYLVEQQPEPTPYYAVDKTRTGGEIAVRVDWTYDRDDRGEVIGFFCAITRCLQPGLDRAVKDAMIALQRLEAQLTQTVATPRVAPRATGPMLSTREQQILDELLRGRSPARIADALGISVHTVRNHMKSIYRRLGVHSREQLSALFLEGTGEWKG